MRTGLGPDSEFVPSVMTRWAVAGLTPGSTPGLFSVSSVLAAPLSSRSLGPQGRESPK